MLVGREKETELLNKILEDNNSHFVAVYGRRRIGKTYLIREAYKSRFTFQHSGIFNGTIKEQLRAFEASVKDAGGKLPKSKAKTWFDAFEELKDLIRQSSEKRKIIFIDELSWMDTPKSNMVKALENFWNGWASGRDDIILITCASATSWMLSKIIHNKGGLYNRLTEQIALPPFSLSECEQYVRTMNIPFNREQILNYYMVFGGVPYYWSKLEKGLSFSQNIDNLLFARQGVLKDEFKYLYASLFKNPDDYITIIRALSSKKSGLSREEIIEKTGICNSGDLTVKLEELESCGFIRKYNYFGTKKKYSIYQLIDSFTLFYFSFMGKEANDEHFWTNQINTPTINTWKGLAFERICLLHIDQIKKKLGISGVQTEVNTWYCKTDIEKGISGSQIDLLIVRKDQVINLCEMKYSRTFYTITQLDDESIRKKTIDLITLTKTKYAIYPTIVTTYGLTNNAYSGNVQSVITMDDLFEE